MKKRPNQKNITAETRLQALFEATGGDVYRIAKELLDRVIDSESENKPIKYLSTRRKDYWLKEFRNLAYHYRKDQNFDRYHLSYCEIRSELKQELCGELS